MTKNFEAKSTEQENTLADLSSMKSTLDETTTNLNYSVGNHT
jgi:hypothetical protein